MSAAALTTLVKMVESLPDSMQDQVVERLREFLEDLQDEMHWDRQFEKYQDWLAREGAKVNREIAEGKSQPMNFDKL